LFDPVDVLETVPDHAGYRGHKPDAANRAKLALPSLLPQTARSPAIHPYT